MNWIDRYKKNKPLVNSIILGLFYFLFCWSLDFGEGTKVLFMNLMLFLPGVTFPLTTCYSLSAKTSYSNPTRISHVFLSVLIYHGGVWLFSAEGRIKYVTVLAGFLGSLLFLLVTKFLLKKNISIMQILITSIASGLAFLQYEINGRNGFFLGLAVFLWTIVNGLTLNTEYRKARNH